MVELRTKVCCNYACELLGVFQSFDNFYSDNSAGDGKETRCKKCRNLASNSRSYDYEANYVEDCSRVRLCNKCGEEKNVVCEFGKKKGGKFGRRAICKDCTRTDTIAYKSNPEVKERLDAQAKARSLDPVFIERTVQYSKKRNALPGVKLQNALCGKAYRANNKDKIKQRNRLRYLSKKDHIKAVQAVYLQKLQTKLKLSLKGKARRATPKGSIDSRMSSNVYQSLAHQKSGRRWEELAGWEIEEALAHWETEGLLLPHPITGEKMVIGKSEIDLHHIQPIASFNYETAEDPEFKQCWALTNLQPLWRDDHTSIDHNILIHVIISSKKSCLIP